MGVRGGFVDGNSWHAAVYGAIFDAAARFFQPQLHVRPPCTRYQSRHHLTLKRFHRLILGSNVTYPTAHGHFLHELLPRLVWLASELPPDIPILTVTSPPILEALSLLHAHGVPLPPSCLVHWDASLVLYGVADSSWQPEACHWPGTVRSLTVSPPPSPCPRAPEHKP